MKIDRRTYADHYGPTTGDRIRLADTDLIIEIEHDATTYGDEAKFGGGKVIRDGMGQSPRASRESGSPDLVITNAVIVDSTGIRKADVGVRDGRISAIGKAGNPGVMDGVTPALAISASTEVLAAEGPHPHLRRHRLARPLHLAEPDSRRVLLRHHDDDRRRHRAGDRHQGHHLHAGRLEHPPHARGGRSVPAELRLPRQGQRVGRRGAARAGARRRARPQAARGLGHDAGRDRRVPRRRRRVRRPGRDPHRHAERNRLRRGHDRGDPRAHDSHLSHRRRRRRPRARHHPAVRRAERPALVDQPDDAVHEEHAGRASRHADGLPSPVAGRAGGRGVRRLAHPPGDDRGRGRAARSRRDQHDVVRLAGDGADRRGHLPHLADGRQDEAAARPAAGRAGRATTTCACAATSRSTRSTRRSRTASRRTSARSRSGRWPIWSCGSRRSSA